VPTRYNEHVFSFETTTFIEEAQMEIFHYSSLQLEITSVCPCLPNHQGLTTALAVITARSSGYVEKDNTDICPY